MNTYKTIRLILITAALCVSCADNRNEQHTIDSIAAAQHHQDSLAGLNTGDQERFLGTYSKEQILNSIPHNKDSIRTWTNYDMMEWKPVDSSILVLNQVEYIGKNRRYAFELCLLKSVNGTLQRIAKGTIDNHAEEDSYYLANTQFDHGTYKISDNEYAIGVSGTPAWYYNGPGYYNYGTNLVLFRVQDNTILPIVLLPLQYTHGDRHQENDSTIVLDTETSDSSEVVLLTTKTGNYYDLVLKTKNSSIQGEGATPLVTYTNTTYAWKKDRYSKVEQED